MILNGNLLAKETISRIFKFINYHTLRTFLFNETWLSHNIGGEQSFFLNIRSQEDSSLRGTSNTIKKYFELFHLSTQLYIMNSIIFQRPYPKKKQFIEQKFQIRKDQQMESLSNFPYLLIYLGWKFPMKQNSVRMYNQFISINLLHNQSVDCLHMANFQNLLQNGEDNDIIPCTPAAVLHILDTQDIDVRNQNVTVIGRSQLVGFPLSVLLLKRNARVTICHSETLVQEHVENADIVISCAGHKELVKGEWIKIGAKVIDVGITRIPGTNKIIGDIEFQKALPRVSFITPVPGGVGPLTVSMLFRNLYRVWCRSNGLKANVDEEEDEFDYAQNYQF